MFTCSAPLGKKRAAQRNPLPLDGPSNECLALGKRKTGVTYPYATAFNRESQPMSIHFTHQFRDVWQSSEAPLTLPQGLARHSVLLCVTATPLPFGISPVLLWTSH